VPYLKTHHVQTGFGHYGVFSGRRWEQQIYPRVRAVIYDNEPRAVLVNSRARPIQPVPAATAAEVTAAAPVAASVVEVEVDAGANGTGESGAKTAARSSRKRPRATP
jgi:poly(3-hydroxybutyrate) depolymerase